MTDAEHEPLLQFVAARTGTRLSRQQRERLLRELQQLQQLPLPEGERVGERANHQLLAYLQSRDGTLALARLLAVISVHKTDLFRDEPQLEALQQHVLRPLAAQARPLRLWSAGCSTGEEVATLLVLLSESGAHPESTVLGSDLSASALEQASRLTFTPEVLKRVPAPLLGRYFEGGTLAPPLRRRARFLQHNLMDRPYPFALGADGTGGPFDVIVCRNVLIYFTPEAARDTVLGFVERLRPGGVLVLSTAEPLLDPVPELTTLRVPGAFFYQRVAPGERVEPAPPPPPPPPPRRAPAPAPPPPRASAPPPHVTGEVPLSLPPEEEGRRLFELVLEWAAEGEDHPETEAGLRKALYLSPRLAGARYLLGLILERRNAVSEASAEYRRALALLEANTALPSGFFLNNERLVKACRVALQRCALPGAGRTPTAG